MSTINAWSFGLSLELALAIAVVLSTLSTVILLTLPTQYNPHSLSQSQKPDSDQDERSKLSKTSHSAAKTVPRDDDKVNAVSVQVVVLGDIGRSPRMQYHAISIAKHGGRVDLIGYNDSEVHPKISSNPLINVIAIPPVPRQFQTSSKLLFVILAPLKVLWQLWCLYYVLGYTTRPSKWMLVQNPPSIPTLMLAQVVCFLRNTRLVIDWHNFGYSILALKLGSKHYLVKISEAYEYICSRHATGHITVTDVMARKLKKDYGISAAPLHDRPPDHFKPLAREERESVLTQLVLTRPYAFEIRDQTRKLIVSSTSWTPDEDFSILLEALVQYSSRVDSQPHLPRIIAIITGKGPQKEYYQSRIESLSQAGKLAHVQILTAWLSAEDYASLLGAADLGVSLHTSSSGVDLPMKVVDMFGTGLPVVGWDRFEAWSELVKEGVNGRGFGSALELRDLLVKLFEGDGAELKRLKEGALLECRRRWDDEWDPVAGKMFGLP